MTEPTLTPNIGDALGRVCNVYLSWTDEGGVVLVGEFVAFSERILDNGMYLITLEIEQEPSGGA